MLCFKKDGKDPKNKMAKIHHKEALSLVLFIISLTSANIWPQCFWAKEMAEKMPQRKQHFSNKHCVTPPSFTQAYNMHVFVPILQLKKKVIQPLKKCKTQQL